VFDVYTIIFLALAVVILLMLRKVLGQRTGRERQPRARDTVRGATKDGPPSRGADTTAASAEPVNGVNRRAILTP
jgi:hypothetical protein